MSTSINPTSKPSSWQKQLRFIVGSAHPMPSLGVTVFTLIFALLSGQRWQVLLLLPMVLLGQFSVGWYNDYLDRERDRSTGRQDKPIALGYVKASTIGWLIVIALVICLACGFAYGLQAGAVYVIAVASGLAYDRWLKQTVASVVPLIVSFGLLPVVIGLGGRPGYLSPLWMVAAGAALGACIHFLNVLPDLADDHKTGVKGTVHYFSYRQGLLVGALLAVAAAVAIGYGVLGIGNIVVWLALAAMAALTLVFAVQYATMRTAAAFATANLMLLAGAVLLLCGAPYLHG